MNPSTDESARFIAFSHPTRVASIDYPEHWASEVSEHVVAGFEFQSPEVREVCVGIFRLALPNTCGSPVQSQPYKLC